MDALSEVLRLARFEAHVTLDATAAAPWCVSVAASGSISRAHLVVDGECQVKLTGAEPVTLKAGEIAFIPRGEAHLVGNPLTADAKPLSALVKSPVAGEQVPVRIGGDGAGTRWIAISSSCERHLAEPLVASLPQLMKVDVSNTPVLEGLVAALGLTLSASAAPPVGAAAERSRLAELVMIEAISRYIDWLPPRGKGWLAGLNDRYVGRALALVHGRPEEPWTV
ncbi:MAG TPA: cupin domain-containing protein, partial [Usitatibacter sp.]|nr:cupin domain-containing protein [Usitatibacter sp.]